MLEFRVVRPDGSVRWHKASAQRVPNDGPGDPAAHRFVGTVLDITREREMLDRLRHSVEHMRVAEDIGRFGLWEVDIRDREVRMSEGMRRLSRLPESTPLTVSLDQFYALLQPQDRAGDDRVPPPRLRARRARQLRSPVGAAGRLRALAPLVRAAGAQGRQAVAHPWRVDGRHRAQGARAVARGRTRQGRGGHDGQERVPRQHEPRDPHADERRAGHDVAAPRDGPLGRAARIHRDAQRVGRVAARAHRRRARLLQDRSGPHHDRVGRVRPVPDAGERRGDGVAAGGSERHRAAGPLPGGRAAAVRRRPGAREAGRRQPGEQRRQVHPARPRAAVGGVRRAHGVGRRRAGDGHRHRHRRAVGEAGAAVPEVLAGRHLDDARIRRHRAGAGDLEEPDRADGRHDRRQQRGRAGLVVLVLAADRDRVPSSCPDVGAVPPDAVC